jgi:hypothetical protein
MRELENAESSAPDNHISQTLAGLELPGIRAEGKRIFNF